MATVRSERGWGAEIVALILFLLLTLAVGAFAGWVNTGDIATWYRGLAKPEWTPPDAWFGPVWTVLYILMAVAAWLVWRQDDYPGRGGALALFFVQLALNAFWTVVFFQWRLIGWGLAEIILLWLFVLMTTYAFWQINRLAGLLFVPYLLWTTFALALNAAIWRLNGVA